MAGSRANAGESRAIVGDVGAQIKHDLVDEADLTEARLGAYRALLIPNAAHLAADTIERIERWLHGGDRRLMVTGKTNLPPSLLGLK